jgi:hypothetical protein
MAGRFFSTDPVAANGNTGENFNRYWFALNHPYRYVDPDGRAPCETDCKERLKAADDTVAKDARTLIGLAGGPLNAIVDLVQGAVTGDGKMAAQGAASAMMEAAIPELETVKVTANAARLQGRRFGPQRKLNRELKMRLGIGINMVSSFQKFKIPSSIPTPHIR